MHTPSATLPVCITLSAEFHHIIHSMHSAHQCIIVRARAHWRVICECDVCVRMFSDAGTCARPPGHRCPSAAHRNPRRPGTHKKTCSCAVKCDVENLFLAGARRHRTRANTHAGGINKRACVRTRAECCGIDIQTHTRTRARATKLAH